MKVQLLMVEADAVARIALMSLGVCSQLRNVSEKALKESNKKAIEALSKVNGAFVQALQNDTSSIPYVQHDASVMKHAAQGVLREMKEDLDLKRWNGRELLHEKIVNGTVKALKNHTKKIFNALAYLPYNRDDQQCLVLLKQNFVKTEHRDLNYVVLHANEKLMQIPEKPWDRLKLKTQAASEAVLDHVFDKSSEDVCGRLTAALTRNGVDTEDFGGVAAVKCGNEFVWYELGYAYFYAAYSSTDYKWQKKGGAYDAECGQIFFFH